MPLNLFLSRRVLLGRIGRAVGVFGTFLLPMDRLEAAPRRSGQSSSQLDHAPLVMLDPGHGGKDPGAIGVSGTYEKHIALAAALELRHLFAVGRRYRVELTRTHDVFIPLEQRVEMAQRQGAALFISMHADSITQPNVRGASVYTMSNTASDPQTAALAARENSADRFLGPAYRGTSPAVARILASLVRRETRIDSAHLARRVVGSLEDGVPMLPNPERHAGFVVLQAANIPSVLVEMGFMSNRQDEAFLRRPGYRAKVAQAMEQAVEGYFAATRGSEIAG